MHPPILLTAGMLLLAGVGCREDIQAPTEPPAAAPTDAAAAVAPAFRQVSAGEDHTCGVTQDDLGYCWGWNGAAQLGDGSTTMQVAPVPIAGGLRFRSVSAGNVSTCAVTTGNRAYCWGWQADGLLGDGVNANTRRPTPGVVTGGLYFKQVSVGNHHACGVTTTGKAYCWGVNLHGELGAGTTSGPELCSGYYPCSTRPVAVRGGLVFKQVSAGGTHTCGITTAGKAYCWGNNGSGQVGDSTETRLRPSPVRVAGGRYYRELDAGGIHTCAVTTGYLAFCWGNGRIGQLGNGKTYLSFWPRRVAGGLSFKRVTAGESHTCGETTLNRGYCWGANYSGQLGDGTTTRRLTPAAVAGGLEFSQLSAGTRFDAHTCARTPAGMVYCWGDNDTGKLGDGTTVERHVPTPVAPM